MAAAHGWKFTVVVPSWTTHVIENESVVLYRVEVRVQAPDADRQQTRSVLRRYSDFRRLHAALKLRLPGRMKGKDAPSKRTLLRVNSSVDSIEKRRHDLEEWVWALLADSEISRSHELAAFLELQAAAGGNPAHRRSLDENRHNIQQPSAGASSTGGSSDRLHSDLAASSGTGDASEDLMEHGSTTGSDLTSIPEPSSIEGGNMHSHMGRGVAAGGRPGMRIEQRPILRKLVADLYDRLEKAKSDMEDAVETAECERRAREMMADRLADAMDELQGDRGPSVDRLKDALEAERETVARLRGELEEARRDQQSGGAEGEAGGSEEAAVARVQAEADALQREMAEKEAALKADMKFLAKEVKKLRKENAQLLSRAEEAEAEAETSRGGAAVGASAESCAAIVELVDSLRSRLAACDIERMASEAEVADGDGPGSGDDVVATSNNRIAALLAEAQLLRNDGQSEQRREGEAAGGGETASTYPAELKELQRAAADILTDVGLLRQQLNNSPHVLDQLGHGARAAPDSSASSKIGGFMSRLAHPGSSRG